MAVTVSEIPKINFSLNDINVKFSSDKAEACEKAAIVFLLSVIQVVYANTTQISIIIEDETYLIPLTAGPGTLEQFVADLQAHWYIGAQFEFNLDNLNTLVMYDCECKKYDILDVDFRMNVSPPEQLSFIYGKDSTIADDLIIYAQLQKFSVEKNKYENIFDEDIALKLDENGCSFWEISCTVNDCLNCEFPELFENEIYKHTKSICCFRFVMYDTCTDENNETITSEKTVSDKFYVIKGGVDSKIISSANFFDFTDGILDFLPREKRKLITYQPQWVSYLVCPEQATNYQFTLQSFDDPDNVLFSEIYNVDVAANEACILSVPVNLCETANDFSILYLDNNQGLTPVNFEIECHKQQNNYYVFCNSLGGVQTLCTNGLLIETPEFEGKKSTDANGNLKAFEKTIKREYEQNTGWQLTPKYKDELEQLLISCKTALVIYCGYDGCGCPNCDNAKYCDIYIKPQSKELTKPNEPLDKVDFKFLVTNISSVVTPDNFC